VPRSWPPALPVILVAPEKSAGPFAILDDEVRDVRGIFVGVDSPATPTHGFPPGEIAVRRARRVRILGASETLVESGGEVLAARVRGDGAPVLYLGFRAEDSDWPKRASFPVFVARVLDGFGPRGGGGGPLGFARVGESAARHLPRGVQAVGLPGGAAVPRGERLLEAGLYRAGGALLAVDLVSETESDNRPASGAAAAARAAPDVGTEAVASWGLAGILAAAALGLLALEWFVSARRS